MQLNLYVLDAQGSPMLEPDPVKWALWTKSHDLVAAEDTLGKCTITTTFLGAAVNHTQQPVLWQTTVTGLKLDGCYRCTGNSDQAMAMHVAALIRVREFMQT